MCLLQISCTSSTYLFSVCQHFHIYNGPLSERHYTQLFSYITFMNLLKHTDIFSQSADYEFQNSICASKLASTLQSHCSIDWRCCHCIFQWLEVKVRPVVLYLQGIPHKVPTKSLAQGKLLKSNSFTHLPEQKKGKMASSSQRGKMCRYLSCTRTTSETFTGCTQQTTIIVLTVVFLHSPTCKRNSQFIFKYMLASLPTMTISVKLKVVFVLLFYDLKVQNIAGQ